MSLHIRHEGAWQEVQRPYVKRNGVWAPARKVWVKQNGVWELSWEWDQTPPPVPELALRLMEFPRRDERYLQLQVRLPLAGNNPDLAMIRVLRGDFDKGTFPSSWNDRIYINKPHSNWPHEPWSDWYYNGYKVGGRAHNDTSVAQYKSWPPEITRGVKIRAGVHRFIAWSMDFYGNWSAPTKMALLVPKEFTGERVIKKAARFQPRFTGTWTWHNDHYEPGDLEQRGPAPTKHGVFYYGNSQLSESIGRQGPPTIKRAQILIGRKNDSGSPTANLYISRNGSAGTPGDTTSQPQLDEGPVKLGTINKGQAKWFDLPEQFWNDLRNNTRSYILHHKDPAKAQTNANDYTLIRGRTFEDGSVRSGEIHVVWEEDLS